MINDDLDKDRWERKALPDQKLITRDPRQTGIGAYTMGTAGSMDRLRAAHEAQRCPTHHPKRCECDGRRR